MDVTLNVGDTCSDGDACTTGDQCLDGLMCIGDALDCDDGDHCTADSCDSVSGCGHAIITGCAPDLPASSNWSLALLALMFAMGGALLLARRDADR